LNVAVRVVTKTMPGLLGVTLALASGCSEREHQLTVAFSNDMHGEIRSCGCVTQDYGGLGRRATFLSGFRKRSENFLLFEGGDFFGLDVNYGREKADLTLQAMSYMGYDGIVVGEKDLSQGVDYLVEKVNKLRLPVVVANLFDAETNRLIFRPTRRFTSPSGLEVGVIGVISPTLAFPEQAPPERLRVGGAKAAVERELRSLRPKVDLVVVLAHVPLPRAHRIARDVQGVDFVVTGHDARPMRRIPRFGNAYLLTTADRGRYMGVGWGSFDRKRGIVELEGSIEALTPEYTDHEAIVKLFKTYDMEIARQERSRVSAGVPPPEQAKNPLGGADACQPCHQTAHDQWLDTKHAHAFEILEARNRQYDRDCTPCHTTGFYELGGFLTVDATPHLIGVQCEACHGNSSEHIENPTISTPGNARIVCTQCHTAEQTPDFAFDGYWPQIAH
jgi:hypothetical protein